MTNPRTGQARGSSENRTKQDLRSTIPAAHDHTYSIALFDQHAAMLTESGIPPEHAERRGYVSVDTKVRLEGLKVTKAGRNVPGLLVPQLRKDGSVWGYQYRPDSPRMNGANKPVKYETPREQRNGIDVPPGVGPMLDDPAVPLWVTEGVKKADAAAVAGLACIALPGVWSWRGRNEHGGKVAIADWEDVALNDRRVILAFDSDVTVKPSVRQALDRLGAYLASKGATVEYCHLPELGDGKCGMDDYLVAGHTAEELWTLVRPDPPEVVEAPKSAPAVPTSAPKPTVAFTGNPAALLDEIAAWVRQYLAVPSEHYITVLTLWAAHTWMVEAFYVTPRLIIDSAEPESGKTRVLELLNLICRAPIFTMNTTIAALYRRLDAGPRTVLLDETDAVFAKGAAQNHEDLRALLDSGYKRGATVDRCVGDASKMDVKEFPAFAPAALAGIVGNMPDTITTRAVTLSMRRRSPDEEIAEFIEEDVLAEAEPLRTQMEAWAADVLDKVRGARPVMPDGVRDRKAEIWRALLAVADLAGAGWPGEAREACKHFVLQARADDASIGVRLLTDLLEIFRDGADIVTAMSTEMILSKLHAMDEAPWGDWRGGKPFSARNLAFQLKRHKVKSTTVRIGEEITKGYKREDLWDPWTRYGVLSSLSLSVTSVTSVTPLASAVTDVTDVTHRGTVADDSTPTLLDEPPGTTRPNRAGDMSTCARCHQPMKVIADGQTTHPMCEETTP